MWIYIQDPWHACGPATGDAYCNITTATTSCIPKNTYSPDFETDPFSVEVGDWSNKYGKVTLTNNMLSVVGNSFYEVLPEELDGYSVVFHCNDGSRAFCAPFETTTVSTADTIPEQGIYPYIHISISLHCIIYR